MQDDVTIRLNASILEALALDDPMNEEVLGLRIERVNLCQIAVTTSLDGLRDLLDACRERRADRREPPWYGRSAAAAARRLETAIARVEAGERP